MKNYIYFCHEMHCKSCVVLIEESLKIVDGVHDVKVDLSRSEVAITGELGDEHDQIVNFLSKFIENHGYKLSASPIRQSKFMDYAYALPMAILLLTGFLLLQKLGFLDLISTEGITLPTAFMIGIIASVSTCLAIVGGLVLSMSANYAKESSSKRPEILFHAGRLIGFFILGGFIGLIGNSFQLGFKGNIAVSIIVALLMLILGLNLLDIKFMRKFHITLPKSFAGLTSKISTLNHSFTPFLIGAATFFLPCGFTQQMQIQTLLTGSFLKGGLTMLTFALGTLPVLALLSFGMFKVRGKPWESIFFKTAGLVVVALGLFNLLNVLVVTGVINPIFNF